jgi:hypothetical protein
MIILAQLLAACFEPTPREAVPSPIGPVVVHVDTAEDTGVAP